MNRQTRSGPSEPCHIAGWRRVPSCVDYQTFVTPWPSMDRERHQLLELSLGRLGVREDNACGVTFVHAPWGFLIVPPPGFPELKVNLYPTVPTPSVYEILTDIQQQIATCTRGGI